jgi:hypothetical protein
MRRSLLLAALVLAITAAPAYAILDGQPDGNAHPYVVAVRSPTGGVCTGSVISAHRVLTAAHCMPPGATARVVFGPNARTSTDFVLGTFNPHPGWCAGCGGGVPGLDTNDVAVVVVPTAMPGPFASLPTPGFAGALPQKQVVTSVGYGIRVRAKDFAGQVLERYRVDSEVVASEHRIAGEYLRLSASTGGTCQGDSGGPSLVGDTIVGITAFSVNGNCAGVTYAQRVDIPATRSFIDSFVP